jgi:hypothetical protein
VVPVVGPFLVVGVLAWVAAFVMGVGSWFGLSSWRQRWAIAGSLAGLGTFELFLHAQRGMLPIFAASPDLVFPVTAALFVGTGVAAAYGTLFVPGTLVRPGLAAGSAEETLWLHDAVDRIRPRALDWGLAGLLSLPALGLLELGVNLTPNAVLVFLGGLGFLGPVFGAIGLSLRERTARRYLAELQERGALDMTLELSGGGPR